MTRKKSNVKALALAVTCAILAGGYSGLNPVYAADPVFHEVKYDSANQDLNYVNSGVTAVIPKIKFCDVVLGGSIGGPSNITVGSYFSIYGSDGSISAASNKFTVSGAGAITATSLTLGTMSDVAATINSKANQTDVEGNRNNINALKTTVGDANSGLVKKVADNEAAITANTTVIDTKADQTALEAANVKITALEGKTTNLSADGKKLTNMDEVGETKVSATTLKVGGKEITADTVAGYDAAVSKTANITYDDATKTTYINKDTDQQVVIDEKGLKVGKNSSRMNDSTGFATTKDLYVGADSADAPTKNGSKFYVDGANGNVVSKGSVTANQAGFNDLAVTNGLTVGSATGNFVNMKNGNVVATGDIQGKNITATGNLSVAGTSTFTGETTFSGGIKTDKIDEATPNAGVTVDGVVLKDGGISAAGGKFTVDADGAVKAAGGKFGVDKDGNTNVGGTLDVTGDTTLKGKLDVKGDISTDGNVTAKGGLSAADGKFKVNGTNGLVTFGNDAGNQSTIAGKTATFGTDTGNQTLIDGGAITAKSLTVASFGAATITADDTLKVGTDVSLDKNGNLDLGTNTLTDAQLGNINNTIKAGQVIEANSGKIGGVKFSTTGEISDVKNITAEKGTIGQVGLEGGKITANNGGTIAGVQFAANNVSGINNLTATGTIQGAVLKVNDNNLLDNKGLKAEKAVIDNLTIDGASITSNNADGSVGVAGITVDKNGAITGVKAIDGVAVAGNTASGLTIGTGATAVTIGGNSLALSSTNFSVDDDGDVKGQSFTAGTSYLKDSELKLNDKNIWNTTEGIRAEKAVIGANTLNAAGISTTGTLDVDGVATFGNSAADQTKITQGKAEFTQGGKTTTIKGGEIETDKLTVNDIVLKNSMKDGAGNTITISGSDGSMSVAKGAFAVDKDGQLTNKITGTAGGFGYETKLETSKSGIKANYTINGNQNTIDMGASGISIGVVSGTTPSVGAGFKAELDKATMGYGTANSIVVSAETITSALGTDVTRVMTNSATEQSIVDKVGAASRSLKAGEIVDAAGGMTITTNNTGTTFSNGTNTTLINGSAITSTKATGDTGVLDGSNLTLKKGANETVLDAGKVTFKSTNVSQHGGTETTIDGGVITTDTLNVQRINLGKEMVNGDGTTTTVSNLSIDEYGNIKAAGGKFTVAGTNNTEGNVGAITNTVGGTNFRTDKTGAGMSFNNNPANPSSGITSNVSVGNNNANVSAGAGSIDVTNESITSKVGTDASSTIKADNIVDKVGDYSVTTNDKGTTFAKKGDVKTTNINGGTITTGKLITDELVIKGNRSGDTSGDGGESGSIAFGGDGTITSNIKDGAKETTFKTTADGVSSEVTNGTYTSNVDQSADRIGSVITGGNVKIGSVADASLGVLQNGAGTVNASGDTVTEASQAFSKDGSITSVAKDKDGKSSTLVQNGTGLEYTDSAKADNATRINSSDVSIGSATDDSKRINLSDLGQIDDLDSEIQSRKEYQDNKTAVGAINAEAGIRREEVARLDNRIDDVNNRVDKVGAMAAAIASLKSIGYDPQAPSEFSIGLGQYKGETGVAMGFFHYPNKNFMINVSLSTAGGETMGGIGATWRFGHKSPQKLLEEQREAQARKELAAAEKYQAAAKLAKEAQERAEYAAKLARQAQVSADNAKAAADATQAKHFQ